MTETETLAEIAGALDHLVRALEEIEGQLDRVTFSIDDDDQRYDVEFALEDVESITTTLRRIAVDARVPGSIWSGYRYHYQLVG